MIVFGILGGLIGFYTIHRYEVIVNGILGLVIIYLVYQQFLKPRELKHGIADLVFKFPKDIKTLIFGFFWCIIVSWAFGHIIDMVIALIK